MLDHDSAISYPPLVRRVLRSEGCDEPPRSGPGKISQQNRMYGPLDAIARQNTATEGCQGTPRVKMTCRGELQGVPHDARGKSTRARRRKKDRRMSRTGGAEERAKKRLSRVGQGTTLPLAGCAVRHVHEARRRLQWCAPCRSLGSSSERSLSCRSFCSLRLGALDTHMIPFAYPSRFEVC